MVSKKLRLALWLLGGLLVLVAAGLFALYQAAQHVPEFYRQALEVDAAAQAKAADRMERQALDLTGDVQKSGHWQAVFTAEELNGWLAVELPKKFPEALPPALASPRVSIGPEGIVLACQYQQDRLRSVLSLSIAPYVPEPGVLALRIGTPAPGCCRCRWTACSRASARPSRMPTLTCN